MLDTLQLRLVRMTKRILFILPTTSQPRFHKRISVFMKAGFEVYVFGYDRGYYKDNTLPEGVIFTSLGSMADGNYIKRIPKLLLSLLKIKMAVYKKNINIIYAFGTDNALVACKLNSQATLVYELGDLRITGNSPFLQRTIMSFFEKYILARIDYLVLTSSGFEKYFEEKYSTVGKYDVLIVENKISQGLFDISGRNKTISTRSGKIIIGLIGLLRYRTIFTLIDAVKNRPEEFELHIHGDGQLREEVAMRVARISNIRFFGPFKYPDDLPAIYEKIDINYVVYDNQELNVQLALPNKLYEAIYFGVPLVVAEKTYLSDKVNEFNIGYSVSTEKNEAIGKLLDQLTRAELSTLQEQALCIDERQLISSDRDAFDCLVD